MDPFLRLYKPTVDSPDANVDSHWDLIAETEYIDNDLNPDFPNIFIDSYLLCNNNLELGLRLEIWDYDKLGSHVFVSRGEFTPLELLENSKN